MRFLNPRLLTPLLLLVIVGIALGMHRSADRNDTAEQLKKLEEAFLIINKAYVEDVDPAALAETAIEAMVESLDPHSSYFDAVARVEVDESYRGSFGGIGIWFEIPGGDTAQVVSTIEGGPSEAVGLRAGDRLVAVDDTSIVGASDDGVRSRLKGPIGTQVTVTVQRLGVPDPLEFIITRDRIPLYSVSSTYMVDDSTGYIRLTRFAQTTYHEFLSATEELSSQGMERLMIDLRDNPGGILEVAVAIVDEIVAGNDVIVQTRGRAVPDMVLRASKPGGVEHIPVIVLVNGNSVSASEVVAGALQDHDRALLVGQRTFGKGLVQNQFELPDESRLQMTTMRYYTPSGRLIQTPYQEGNRRRYLEDKLQSLTEAALDPERYLESIPDSLKFFTLGGRTVFGGGGIFPDHPVPSDTTEAPAVRVIFAGLLFEPFRTWFARHEQNLRTHWKDREEDFKEHFAFLPEEIDEFWDVAASARVPVTITADPDGASLTDRVLAYGDVKDNEEILRGYLKALLARQLYGSRAAQPYFNQIDRTFLEALTLWDKAATLQ